MARSAEDNEAIPEQDALLDAFDVFETARLCDDKIKFRTLQSDQQLGMRVFENSEWN
jgi:hypothetical protein